MTEKSNFKAWQDAVSAGIECLSPEQLHTLLDNPLGEGAAHLQICPHCQAELAMIRRFESSNSPGADETMVAQIVARLEKQSGMSAPRSTPVTGRRVFLRLPAFLRLPYLAGAVAAALVVGLGISLYFGNRVERPSISGDLSGSQVLRSDTVQLTAPSGTLAETPQSFQWEKFPGAKSYSIELLEVDGSLLWQGQSEQNVLSVSPELRARIRSGKTLIWKVTALDLSGKAIASSNSEHFVVKRINGAR